MLSEGPPSTTEMPVRMESFFHDSCGPRLAEIETSSSSRSGLPPQPTRGFAAALASRSAVSST